jgi:hypothetical protein
VFLIRVNFTAIEMSKPPPGSVTDGGLMRMDGVAGLIVTPRGSDHPQQENQSGSGPPRQAQVMGIKGVLRTALPTQ